MNKVETAEWQKKYRARNRGKLNLYTKEWNKKTGYEKKRYLANKEKSRTKSREYSVRIKKAIFDVLGSVCVRCEFDDIRALQIDHVNGGGNKEVKSLKGISKYAYILKKIIDGSVDYQILCANCNWIKRHENNEVRQPAK